jgi:hypothetical protein
MQAAVETQLAMGIPDIVDAMSRLRAEGLDHTTPCMQSANAGGADVQDHESRRDRRGSE